jgi:hypothetical protein
MRLAICVWETLRKPNSAPVGRACAQPKHFILAGCGAVVGLRASATGAARRDCLRLLLLAGRRVALPGRLQKPKKRLTDWAAGGTQWVGSTISCNIVRRAGSTPGAVTGLPPGPRCAACAVLVLVGLCRAVPAQRLGVALHDICMYTTNTPPSWSLLGARRHPDGATGSHQAGRRLVSPVLHLWFVSRTQR